MKNKRNKTTSTLQSKIFFFFAAAIFVISIIFFANNITTIRNINRPYLFCIIFFLVGLALAIPIIYILKSFIKPKPNQTERFMETRIAASFGIIVFVISFAAILNSHSLSKTCETFIVISKEQTIGKDRCYIFNINYNAKSEKVYSSYKYWKYIQQGERINVCTNKGKLGFDFLTIIGDN